MGIIKSFDIKRLMPFRKSSEHLVESAKDEEKMKGVDTDLKPDEERYIRHFLSFADIFLHPAEPEPTPEQKPDKVIPMPAKDDKAA